MLPPFLTPQAFYNWGACDVLDDQMVMGMIVSLPRMDALGVAPNSGSGTLWRREALNATGGFRTESKGEDYLTSWDMISRGYTSVYCRELLQSGLVPWSLEGWYRQHRRWDTTACEMLSCFLRQLLASPHLTWVQKYCMVGFWVGWIQAACLLIGQWAFACFLLLFSFGPSVGHLHDAAPLRLMMFLAFFANLAHLCHGLLLYKATPSPWEMYLRAGVRSRFNRTWVPLWAAKHFLGIKDLGWEATGKVDGKEPPFLMQVLQYTAPHLFTWALWVAASVTLLVGNLYCGSSVLMLAMSSNLVFVTLAQLPEIVLPVWYYMYGVPKMSERKGMVPRDSAGVPCLKPAALWPGRDWRVVALMGLQPMAIMMGLITVCVVCILAPLGATVEVPFLCKTS